MINGRLISLQSSMSTRNQHGFSNSSIFGNGGGFGRNSNYGSIDLHSFSSKSNGYTFAIVIVPSKGPGMQLVKA